MAMRPTHLFSAVLRRQQILSIAAATSVPPSRSIKSVSSGLLDACSKPAPWPYETKDYKWYHSFFNFDVTTDRLDENSKIICIDGNIGVGKSTLAKSLACELGMKYMPEANVADIYEYVHGYDLRDYDAVLPEAVRHFEIQDFYENPHHPSVPRFQIKKYYARNIQYVKAILHLMSTGQGVILERSAFSDFVFVDAMANMGLMSRQSRRHYYEMKSNTIQDLFRPHVCIYLDAPVEVCMERIKKRNIPWEVNSEVMTLDYLKQIEIGYKEFYLKQMEPFVEMLVYDWTKPAEAEVVADDLEKVDLDRVRVYFDPKFRDWRELHLPSDWDVERVRYTKWKSWMSDNMDIPNESDAKELWVDAESMFRMREILEDELIKNKGTNKPGDWRTAVKNMFALR